MSSESAIFFTDEKRARIIANTMSKVRGELDSLRDGHDEKHKFLLEFIGQTLFHIQGSPRSFDERCIMNISVLGDRFIEEVEGFSLNKGDAEHLFAYCYRFIIEYQLSRPDQIASDLLDVLARVNRPWFPRHSPSSGNSVSHTLLETAA